MRIPFQCNHDPETTVLAHMNGGGMGTKHHDLFGAFACSACHDEYDRRTTQKDKSFVDLCFMQAMQRTQQWWLDRGYVTTK
jgi:hypothetical protein